MLFRSDIQKIKTHTGCNAVMIGRAAIGNPWIFSGLDRNEVTDEMALSMVKEHLQRHLAFYGDHKGMILFRKHAMHYLKLHWFPRDLRIAIMTQTEPKEFLTLVETAFNDGRLRLPLANEEIFQ